MKDVFSCFNFKHLSLKLHFNTNKFRLNFFVLFNWMWWPFEKYLQNLFFFVFSAAWKIVSPVEFTFSYSNLVILVNWILGNSQLFFSQVMHSHSDTRVEMWEGFQVLNLIIKTQSNIHTWRHENCFCHLFKIFI